MSTTTEVSIAWNRLQKRIKVNMDTNGRNHLCEEIAQSLVDNCTIDLERITNLLQMSDDEFNHTLTKVINEKFPSTRF